MPSLVATTYALARKPCVSTHYVRTNTIIGIFPSCLWPRIGQLPLEDNKRHIFRAENPSLYPLCCYMELGE